LAAVKTVLVALRFWALFALGLRLLAYILPTEIFWSVWPYTLLPPWLDWVLAIGAGSLVIPGWGQKAQRSLARLWQMVPGKNYPRFWFICLSLLAMPIFWLARIRHLQWGDAKILVIGLSHPQPVIYNWQAPLTVYLHQRLWALVAQPLFGWGVDTVYALVSVLCGGCFVYVLLKLAYELGRDTLERLLIAGFVLTSGSMQLFFGYVENYTIIALGILIFLWLGLKALRGEAPFWSAALALSLTNAFHPSTLVLWPALFYLAYRRYRLGEPGSQVLLGLILPPLIVGNSVLTLMELGDHGLNAFLGDDRPGGGDHIWFVPLFEIRSGLERYTMFSLAHFLDWANLHFLISVFGLITILLVAGRAWPNRKRLLDLPLENRHQLWFLGLASFFYVLLSWVWNADYGLRKDWDLFSPSAFVYSLLAALLLIHLLKDKASQARATLLILVVSALHTLTWIWANIHPLNLI
jgi:hypothetical protein